MVAYYNENKKCTGVVCDKCSKVCKEKFIYFSIKVAHIQVDIKTGVKDNIADIDDKYLDLDFCEECFMRIHNEVKINLNKVSKNGTWSSDVTQSKITHKQKM